MNIVENADNSVPINAASIRTVMEARRQGRGKLRGNDSGSKV